MARLALLAWACIALAQGQVPKRVLYITHSAGFRHDSILVSRESLRTLSPGLAITATEDLSAISAGNLRNFDAVLFFTSGELALSAGQRSALLDFVRAGGGFGGVHSATDTLYTWPEYGDLIGAYFDGHPWVQPVRIDVEDPEHPAMAGLGSSFVILDEIYQFRGFDRKRVRVLMTLDLTSVDPGKEGAQRNTEDFPLAWVRSYGAGRVFYTALGHFDETWRDPRFLGMMEGALLWMTGQKPGAAEPRFAVSELRGLANAASATPPDRVAPGSLASLYGAGLTTGSTMTGSYASRLAGTGARIGERRLPLLYASPTQLNALIPADVPEGPGTLTVEAAGSAPAQRTIEIVKSAPGVFAMTTQPGAITVWATGTGAAPIEAAIDGTSARVLFRGPAPGFAGLEQINIAAPAGRTARLQLTAGGAMFYEVLVDLLH